jgi:hypothetical protein
MKVCHLAETFNLPVTSQGAHDITVLLLATAPNRSYPEAHGFGLDPTSTIPSNSRTAARSRPTARAMIWSSTGRRSSRSASDPARPPDGRILGGNVIAANDR